MHILYINKVSPRLGGGAETRIWEVGQRLIKRGHQVSVVCTATQPDLPEQETVNGIQIHYVRTVPTWFMHGAWLKFYVPKLAFYFRNSYAIEQIAQAEVDIIRDDLAPFPSVSAVRIGHRYNIPLIATVHNLGKTWARWRRYYGVVLGTAGYLGESWLRRRTPYAFVISDSEWMRRALEGDWPSERLAWIPNGVDPSLFYPSSVRKLENGQTLNLFYAGRFVWLKGQQVLVAAFAQALQAGLKAKLHLAGHGPLIDAVRRQVKSLNLESHVIFHGAVQKSDMPQLYRQMDIFVSPSFFEGLSLSLLEAMASGLPVICTRIEATEGILDDGHALFVPPNKPDALAHAILCLAEDPEARQQMGAWSRREVETKYTWEMVTDQELAVYEHVINRRKLL
jgi:glycosyltransferase involved in cell wall biosynthesis